MTTPTSADLRLLAKVVSSLEAGVREKGRRVILALGVGAAVFALFATIAIMNFFTLRAIKDANATADDRAVRAVTGINRCVLERTPEACTVPTTAGR